VRSLEQVECARDRNQALELLVVREGRPCPWVLLDRDGQADGSRPFTPVRATVVEESRNRVVVDVQRAGGEGEALLAFTRPWYPGYRAFCDGRPLRVEVLNLTMPAVRLPAGVEGRVELVYRPRSLVRGQWLAMATGLYLCFVCVLWLRWRRLPGAAG
jgi:hypothetical protein